MAKRGRKKKTEDTPPGKSLQANTLQLLREYIDDCIAEGKPPIWSEFEILSGVSTKEIFSWSYAKRYIEKFEIARRAIYERAASEGKISPTFARWVIEQEQQTETGIQIEGIGKANITEWNTETPKSVKTALRGYIKQCVDLSKKPSWDEIEEITGLTRDEILVDKSLRKYTQQINAMLE